MEKKDTKNKSIPSSSYAFSCYNVLYPGRNWSSSD